jgi:hypothetical protein
MMDLTNSLGITPISIGPIKIVNNTKPFFHFYNVTQLKLEIAEIATSLNNLNTTSNDIDERLVANLFLVKEKLISDLNLISISSPKSVSMRNKRGLINGLGTALSWLTGVPDATDEAKINKALKQIRKKQEHLSQSETSEIKFNYQLIDKINKDIGSVNRNNKRIKEMLEQDLDRIDRIGLILIIQNNMERTLAFINQISTTLEHCADHTYHLGMLPDNAINEMNAQTPLITTDKRAIRALSRVNCVIKNNLIIVQLDVPIDVKSDPAYYVLSYPVIQGNTTFTVHARERLIIEKESELFEIKDCEMFNEEHFCKSKTPFKDSCILNIILEGDVTQYCRTIQIPEVAPFARFIPACNCELSYKKKLITINGHPMNVPEVALVHRDPTDIIPEFPRVTVVRDTYPILIKKIVEPKVKTSTRFEKLKELDHQEIKASVIEIGETEHSGYTVHVGTLSLTLIIIIGVIIASLYYKFKSHPTPHTPNSNNTVLYVPAREAP